MRDKDLDLPETMPLIAWQIEIGEYFVLPPLLWDLFAQPASKLVQEDIYNLQNKLPVNIECYDVEHSFIPEKSFIESSQRDGHVCDFDRVLWCSQSLQRPLFSYQSAQPVELPENSRFWAKKQVFEN